jgi:hypothetical protein
LPLLRLMKAFSCRIKRKGIQGSVMSSQHIPFHWQQVDQALASLMLNEVTQEFLELARDDLQHIRYQNIGNENRMTVPSERLEMHRLRAEELAAGYYSVYCEVWRSQQKPLSPEFLRAICPNSLRGLFSARVTGLGSEFSMEQMRTQRYNTEWLKAAMGEFTRSMDRLYARWVGLAEIDAKGLEYMLAAAPNSPDVGTTATQVVHARIQLRIVEARLASIEARITMCGRALSATQSRQPDNSRIKSLERRLDGLKADKKQFEVRQDEWQRSLNTALRRSAELRTISPSLSDHKVRLAVAVDSERQPQGVAYREKPSLTPEPNAAGAIGPEGEIAQARERVRYFEAKIAATDTNIAAFQQSLTHALVHGTSAFKPADIGKAIRKLHADRKDLEFRRDDWQLNLNTALSRAAGARQQDVPAPQALPGKDGKIQEGPGTKGGSAHIWHGFHVEFKALAEEELRKDPNNRGDRWLRAYLTRDDETGEEWHVSAGVDEGFRARFEVLATRAGITLRAQVLTIPPLEFWLHALFENLLEDRSAELFAANKETGGIILRVCEASATYCARLEKTALGQPVGAEVQTLQNESTTAQREGGEPQARVAPKVSYASGIKRAIALVLSITPDASDLQICRHFDEDGMVELPESWTTGDNRLFELAYKDPRHRPKVEKMISKVRTDMRRKGLLS